MTESFAELFEQSQSLAKLKPGAIVSGTVVEIRPDVVVINAGLKSEGIVPIEQFKSETHQRIKRIKSLMDAGKLNDKLRWTTA